MKNKILVALCGILIALISSTVTKAQTSPVAQPSLLENYPWTSHDLIEPETLAGMIKDTPAKLLLILNIGAVEDIKGAKHIGAANKAEYMAALKNTVSTLPKNASIVIYCGCCPFTKCPNVQPAFKELKVMGFTNVRLLNLPVNLHTNWTSKGYPLASN
ncbi:rhodanese-like domain-containing protein [Mucilaginibacter sp. CAU 1740]|uniref:rhodanese-like domain-containing protein n=1 Tax=Mucilaginibacter sp. CAU 1740 TaxID=3140365 RepID=UPI00325C1071